MNILRFLTSLLITFLALTALFTLIKVKLDKREKKNRKGFRMLCPKCDTLLVEIVFPENIAIFHYLHFGNRIVKKRRKLTDGKYWFLCYKCGQELEFVGKDLKEMYKEWVKEDV